MESSLLTFLHLKWLQQLVVAQESASNELFLRRVKMSLRTVLDVYLSALNNQFIVASSRMQVFHPQNGEKKRYAWNLIKADLN